jgi:HEAT repeat protein
VFAAVIAAGATVGFQLAGKATRDALFLSTFGVAALPRMLIAAAVVSAGLTIGLTHVMNRTGPGRLIPPLFGASAGLLLLEWALVDSVRRAAAILFYLHYAGLGALLVSGLWAMVNERFDPRRARAAIGRIATGASVGGLLGGILPERVGASQSLTAMLPILAALHLLAGWLVLGLQPTAGTAGARPGPVTDQSHSPRAVLRASSYLRALALLVVLAAAAEGVLDYVFKLRVAEAASEGAELLRLFAAFYTATALLAILMQVLLLRPTLRGLGVARTAALLPGGVVAGAFGGMLLPGLGTLIGARGLEMVLRNSMFRAAYELLFIPTTPEEQHATKLLLDVGATRVGDVVGGAVVQGAIAVGRAGAGVLLGVTGLFALAALVIARQLHAGYVGALERSLHLRAGALPEPAPDGGTTLLQSFGAFDLTQLRLPPVESGRITAASDTTSGVPAMQVPLTGVDLRRHALASADPAAVRQALRAGPLSPELIDPAIGLLAWDEVAADAALALRKIAAGYCTDLVAHLLDQEEDFAVRRRLVRVLAEVPGKEALAGLLAALEDPRFEVRYRAGRALASRRAAQPELTLEEGRILAIVLREVAVERGVWESRQLIDQADDDWLPRESEVVRDRATRSLEHVFNLLSLVLSPDPLRLAFHGLSTADPHLRGTALEYLEMILPDPVRQRLWRFLEVEAAPTAPRRSADAILHQLLASRESIVLALAAVRERGKE